MRLELWHDDKAAALTIAVAACRTAYFTPSSQNITYHARILLLVKVPDRSASVDIAPRGVAMNVREMVWAEQDQLRGLLAGLAIEDWTGPPCVGTGRCETLLPT